MRATIRAPIKKRPMKGRKPEDAIFGGVLLIDNTKISDRCVKKN